MSVPDAVELRGIRVLGTHGVLPEERERAQPFEVDLDIALDLSRAGRSDDLGDTLDYGEVVESVAKVVGAGHCALLERLAELIADEVMADSRVSAVTVAVRKLRPPVPVDMATAGVRIHRSR